MALAKAGESTALASGAPVGTLPLDRWSQLHAPLALGFLAAPLLAPVVDGSSAGGGEEAAEAAAAASAAAAAAAAPKAKTPDADDVPLAQMVE